MCAAAVRRWWRRRQEIRGAVPSVSRTGTRERDSCALMERRRREGGIRSTAGGQGTEDGGRRGRERIGGGRGTGYVVGSPVLLAGTWLRVWLDRGTGRSGFHLGPKTTGTPLPPSTTHHTPSTPIEGSSFHFIECPFALPTRCADVGRSCPVIPRIAPSFPSHPRDGHLYISPLLHPPLHHPPLPPLFLPLPLSVYLCHFTSPSPPPPRRRRHRHHRHDDDDHHHHHNGRRSTPPSR